MQNKPRHLVLLPSRVRGRRLIPGRTTEQRYERFMLRHIEQYVFA